MKDKQSVAVKLYDLKNRERLIKSLSISPRTFDGWVSNKAKQLKEQKEEEAINLYLHAEFTQRDVAEQIGISLGQFNDMFTNCKNAKNEQIANFTPFLYNIWNTSKEEILALYLKCFNTVEIGEMLGISDETVRKIIKDQETANMQKLGFTPFIYNIWNTSKEDNSIKHFEIIFHFNFIPLLTSNPVKTFLTLANACFSVTLSASKPIDLDVKSGRYA